MNRSQDLSIKKFRKHLEESISANAREKYGKQITRFDVEPTEFGGFWIAVEIELIDLPKGNLLRLLDKEHWFVHCGPRGRLESYSHPKSYEQFENIGRKAFGITFKKS